MRLTYESLEATVRWNSISACPTVLTSEFQIWSRKKPDNLIEDFCEYLQRLLPQDIDRGVVGYAEIIDQPLMALGILERLAPWPRTYSVLGERFDDLHRILVGPSWLCVNLKRTLGLEEVCTRSLNEYSTAVLIPESVLKDPQARAAARAYLVTRDETTASKQVRSDPRLGQFAIAGRIFFSKRRQRFLSENGFLANPPNYVYQPIIGAEFCRLLEIDVDEMLVVPFQKSVVSTMSSELEKEFSALPEQFSLAERIVLAHERVLKRRFANRSEFDALWDFMRAKFFG
jgi:hypothetical protein